MTKPPYTPTLGDNLCTPHRKGMSAVFLSAKQTRATQDVLHLMQAIARVQPLDETITKAAKDAVAALTIVLAKTSKGDQPLLPGIETPPAKE